MKTLIGALILAVVLCAPVVGHAFPWDTTMPVIQADCVAQNFTNVLGYALNVTVRQSVYNAVSATIGPLSETDKWVIADYMVATGCAIPPRPASIVAWEQAQAPASPPPPPPPSALVCAPVLASTALGIVAFGDSITAGSYVLGANAPGPNPEYAYPALLRVWRNVPVVNLGVPGNHTAHMLGRIGDVLASNMPFVILFGGTNDVGAGTPTATTIANVDQMVQALVGREVVIVGPLPRNNVSASGIQALRSALRDYAGSKGLRFIDPYPAFEDRAQPGRLAAHLSDDGVHPNGAGSLVLAKLIAHAVGWRLPGGD